MPNGSIGFMNTPKGRHSGRSYAMITADRIVAYDPTTASPERIMAARDLELRVANLLIGHHQTILDSERAALKADTARVDPTAPDDPAEHAEIDAVVDLIAAAGEGTEWGPTWASDDGKASIKRLLVDMLKTAMHVERGWHADENPDHPASQARRAALAAA